MSTDEIDEAPERTVPLLDVSELDELDALLRQVPQGSARDRSPNPDRSWLQSLLKWLGRTPPTAD